MVTVARDIDLEQAIDNSDYTPSFAPRSAARKPTGRQQPVEPTPSLSRNNSSNVPTLLEEEPAAPRRTLLGLHKANSIESRPEEKSPVSGMNRPSTSAAKSKGWDMPLPEMDVRPPTRAETLAPPPLLEQPLSGYTQRGMKPPLSRKGSEKAFVNDQVTKEGFFHPPSTAPQDFGKTLKINDNELSKLKELYEQQNKSIKDFYEKQLHNEKSVLETRLKELRETYEKEKAMREVIHKQELNSKMSLKELELSKLRDLHRMELESKNQQLKQLQTLHEATSRAQRKTQVVEQWELKLKEQNSNMSQLLSAKEQERLTKLSREQSVRQQRLKKQEEQHEQREKQWRQSTRRQKDSLQKEYQRLQVLQDSILKKQKQTEKDYQQRKQELTASIEQQRRNYERKSQDLQLLRGNMEHQKKLAVESREHYQLKTQQALEERQQLLRQCDQEKRSAIQKQVDLEAKLKIVVLREAELDCLKEQIKGKSQLLQLERRRVAAELSSVQRPDLQKQRVFKTYLKGDAKPLPEITHEPLLKKTLTELKNGYLEGLQQLRGSASTDPRPQAQPGPRPFTFGRFYGAS